MRLSASRVASTLRTKLINTTAAAVLLIGGVGFTAPLLATQSASAATRDVCASGCTYTDVQTAINAASAGDTVTVGPGTYSSGQFLVLSGKEITIEGSGVDTTFMRLTNPSDGFKVQANNVTLKNFTINSAGTAIYGLRAQGVTNLNVQNVKITGMTKSAFDINGVTSSQFTNITAQSNGGNGVSVTDSSNLTFTNVTTSGNGWGGVAFYAKGTTYPCGVSGITFGGTTSLSEVQALYTGIDTPGNPACTITGLSLPASLTYKVKLNNYDPQNIYVKSAADAATIATVYSALSPVATSTSTGSYMVAPGLKIQDAINAAAAGDTINVTAGDYIENITINKAVSVLGAGAATTRIIGTNGNATPVTFSSNNATLSGFTITHNYTPSELAAWNFNNNGVIFNQGTTGNTLSNSIVTLNRNGVYINNAQGNIVTDNTITNNRTGLNLTNNINNTQITNNTISNNWTLGLVYYSQGFPTNFDTVTITGNTFDSNWYSEVVVKDAGSSTGSLDLRNNTFTDNPITYSTSSDSSLNEPGFAAQQPVELGGHATPPTNSYPTIRIYNSASMDVEYTPTPTPPTPPSGGGTGSTGGSGSPGGSGSGSNTPAATTTYIAYYDGNGDAVTYDDSTVATTDENTTEQGEVKGESTNKSNANKDDSKDSESENSSAFLGLGWWWIPIILVGLGVIYWAVVKRADTTSSSS